MRKVNKYVAADGTLFDSKTDAKKHEVTVEATKDFNEYYDAAITTGRPEALVKSILGDPEMAFEILKKLVRINKKADHGLKLAA